MGWHVHSWYIASDFLAWPAPFGAGTKLQQEKPALCAGANFVQVSLLCAEISHVLEAVGGGEGELHDLEPSIDSCRHRLGAGLGGMSTKDCARAVLRPVQDDVRNWPMQEGCTSQGTCVRLKTGICPFESVCTCLKAICAPPQGINLSRVTGSGKLRSGSDRGRSRTRPWPCQRNWQRQPWGERPCCAPWQQWECHSWRRQRGS